MLIDTHAHLNFSAFNKDRDKIIKKCLDNNVWVINAGTNLKTSKEVVDLAQDYEKGIYAAVGLHPINLETGLVKIKADVNERKSIERDFEYEKYKELADSKKVVAIGEIGLDYYWKPKTTKKKELFKQKQKELLLKQLNLAKELNLPIIFHCRMAHQELIKFLLENPKVRPEKAVAHSFVGGLDELKKYLAFGFYIGFNGIIFKKIEGVNFEQVIKNTPLDKLLIETDCPYLVPPALKAERNEPVFIKYIAERLAGIKKISLENIAEITTENARKLFEI